MLSLLLWRYNEWTHNLFWSLGTGNVSKKILNSRSQSWPCHLRWNENCKLVVLERGEVITTGLYLSLVLHLAGEISPPYFELKDIHREWVRWVPRNSGWEANPTKSSGCLCLQQGFWDGNRCSENSVEGEEVFLDSEMSYLREMYSEHALYPGMDNTIWWNLLWTWVWGMVNHEKIWHWE